MPPISSVSPRRIIPTWASASPGIRHPHPESPSFASDWRYTVAKIREGADFVITQLFFDVREYLHFVDRLSDMGVSVPVIPGILPIQSLESIRAHALPVRREHPGQALSRP